MERCELCALPLAPEHPHLFASESRQMVCACEACAMLFALIDARSFRRVRAQVRRLSGIPIADGEWAALGIPVGLAFVSPWSDGSVVAGYPGPAGATLATVDRAAWDNLSARHPGLRDLEPDVEAWLVNRTGAVVRQYRVSIDHCYRLAGLVRSRWSGVAGGPRVTATIDEFFRALDEQAA